jgi:hypothetical protein
LHFFGAVAISKGDAYEFVASAASIEDQKGNGLIPFVISKIDRGTAVRSDVVSLVDSDRLVYRSTREQKPARSPQAGHLSFSDAVLKRDTLLHSVVC